MKINSKNLYYKIIASVLQLFILFTFLNCSSSLGLNGKKKENQNQIKKDDNWKLYVPPSMLKKGLDKNKYSSSTKKLSDKIKRLFNRDCRNNKIPVSDISYNTDTDLYYPTESFWKKLISFDGGLLIFRETCIEEFTHLSWEEAEKRNKKWEEYNNTKYKLPEPWTCTCDFVNKYEDRLYKGICLCCHIQRSDKIEIPKDNRKFEYKFSEQTCISRWEKKIIIEENKNNNKIDPNWFEDDPEDDNIEDDEIEYNKKVKNKKEIKPNKWVCILGNLHFNYPLGSGVDPRYEYCIVCEELKNSKPNVKKWECTGCTTINSIENKCCFICKTHKYPQKQKIVKNPLQNLKVKDNKAKNIEIKYNEKDKKEVKKIKSKKWVCSHCTLENNGKRKKCRACKKEKNSKPHEKEKWECKGCTTSNSIENAYCFACRTLRYPQKQEKVKNSINVKEKNKVEANPVWECSCKNINDENFNFCVKCGEEKPHWKCKGCNNNENKKEFQFCFKCGIKKPNEYLGFEIVELERVV